MKQARKCLQPTNGCYMHAPVLSDLARRNFVVQATGRVQAQNCIKRDTPEVVQERWRKKGWRVHDYMLHPFFKGQVAKVMRHVDDPKGAGRLIVIHPLGTVSEPEHMELAGWYSPVVQEKARVSANSRMPVGQRRVPAPISEEQKKAMLKAFSK